MTWGRLHTMLKPNRPKPRQRNDVIFYVLLFSARLPRRCIVPLSPTPNLAPGQEAVKEDDEDRPWWEGAGKKELPPDRARDYQDVEEVLRTGRRSRRPRDGVTWSVSLDG